MNQDRRQWKWMGEEQLGGLWAKVGVSHWRLLGSHRQDESLRHECARTVQLFGHIYNHVHHDFLAVFTQKHHINPTKNFSTSYVFRLGSGSAPLFSSHLLRDQKKSEEMSTPANDDVTSAPKTLTFGSGNDKVCNCKPFYIFLQNFVQQAKTHPTRDLCGVKL